jgi:hypothetical protein
MKSVMALKVLLVDDELDIVWILYFISAETSVSDFTHTIVLRSVKLS